MNSRTGHFTIVTILYNPLCLAQDVVRLSNKVYDKTKVTVSDQVAKYAPGASQEGGSDRARRSSFSFAVTEMLDVPPHSKQLMLQVSVHA